jgi:ribosomal protein S18 acetylase RimI-like enzyme
MKDGKDTVGVVLGYSRKQFLQAELPGAVNMLRATPFSHWPFLIGTAGKALANYVPPPADDAYYINNIAVSTEARGQGYGTRLLAHVMGEARSQGYRSLELDVTHVNDGAIRFYKRNGFAIVSESGSTELFDRYQLPVLKRMRLLLADKAEMSLDNSGVPTSTTVVKDVTGLYPVQVDEVYAPGTIEQLQQMLQITDKPLSIGGGRFSMGGQTAFPGTLHIDMRGLNRVIDFKPEKRSIRVEAGIRWKQIQDRINAYGLAIKIMQTYANFTVGGSLSVNCHGRYVGLGPVILAVGSIDLILHDGKLVRASPRRNKKMFYATIGGYGAIGIIVAAELDLAENRRIERIRQKLPIEQYQRYFAESVREDAAAVFHNADMIPPKFSKVSAVTGQQVAPVKNCSCSKNTCSGSSPRCLEDIFGASTYTNHYYTCATR